MLIILPQLPKQKELYETCNQKILCENHAINQDLCKKYINTIDNISINISIPN